MAFRAYVQQILAPELTAGDVVIMDNLPAHKVKGVRQAIEAAGVMLMYLPAYSPDFNPIKMAFSKFKALLRAQPRARSTLCGGPSDWPRRLHANRMPKLLRRRKIRCNLNGKCLSYDVSAHFSQDRLRPARREHAKARYPRKRIATRSAGMDTKAGLTKTDTLASCSSPEGGAWI
jgi:transposase